MKKYIYDRLQPLVAQSSVNTALHSLVLRALTNATPKIPKTAPKTA